MNLQRPIRYLPLLVLAEEMVLEGRVVMVGLVLAAEMALEARVVMEVLCQPNH